MNKNSEYTFKFNKNLGKHGWLRLTPAYSVKLVKELISDTAEGSLILDPFSGTATTGLCSLESGFDSYLCDINPFLIWFGNTKLSQFTAECITSVIKDAESIVVDAIKNHSDNHWVPNIHNISRWWDADTLKSLSSLRYAIVKHVGEPSDNNRANLIWIAFCRLIIETSSAAFNHVSMSFNSMTIKHNQNEINDLFIDILTSIASSSIAEYSNSSRVINCDSRCVGELKVNKKINHVVTSPPYPNRMSYIRELRPYMYWTKFLSEAPEAAELDWMAIGGTWGSATSKLKDWKPEGIQLPDQLIETCTQIENSDDKNSLLMSRYVHKYFFDMHKHFMSLREILSSGAKIDYIVGNSSFYGIQAQSDEIFEESLKLIGFKDVSSKIVRKRNSNKSLFEYCVSAYWP